MKSNTPFQKDVKHFEIKDKYFIHDLNIFEGLIISGKYYKVRQFLNQFPETYKKRLIAENKLKFDYDQLRKKDLQDSYYHIINN